MHAWRERRRHGNVQLRLALFLVALSLRGATYYVASATSTPAGSDSNDGSIGAPWLTLQHAVSTVACGDTINIVADGNYIAGDAILPYFSCAPGTTTTIQSSKLAMFQPIGYRTQPAIDSANYGKLKLNTSIQAVAEAHGSFRIGGDSAICNFSNVNTSTNVLTIGFCTGAGALTGLANGRQVELEASQNGPVTNVTIPTSLTNMQHYFVINCTGTCGNVGSTFQLAATSGGTALALGTCDAACVAGTVVSEPMQFTSGSSTITSPDSFTWTNGTPVSISSVGILSFGTIPSPFQLDTAYYIVGASGNTFGLSATLGGMAISATSNGTGPLVISNTNVPHDWAFRGLEIMENFGHLVFNVLLLGGGNETSTIGMVSNMEVDRVWIHDDPADSPAINRGIADNGINLYVHDSYIAGMRYGENQAIGGWGSPGPTRIINNFLEAATENTLYGGSMNASGTSNANKTITGNYYYKPPIWKITQSTATPSGACLYDTTDPSYSGGEWYRNTGTSQNYQCGSDHLWHTTGTALPTALTIKNLAEGKNLRTTLYEGNVMNYSWAQSQAGQAFSHVQEVDSGPGAAIDHITIRNNKATNIYYGATFGSTCNKFPSHTCWPSVYPGNNVLTNNLLVESPLTCGVSFDQAATCGYTIQATGWGGFHADNSSVTHNTIIMPPAANLVGGLGWGFFEGLLGGTFNNAWTFANNVTGFDFIGESSIAEQVFFNYFKNTTATHNAMVQSNAAFPYVNIGATNTFTVFDRPANDAAIGYVDFANGDYHLASTSPYSASCASGCSFVSTDGTDLGADIDAINAATSGAVDGTPTWAVQEGFTITPGLVSAVATYTRPGSMPCSLTLYNAPARIAANENADTNTSGEKLDTRTGNTVVGDNVTFNLGFNTPLMPATTYWYSLSCVAADMSTWLLAGDSFTTAAVPPSRISGRVTISGKAVIH